MMEKPTQPLTDLAGMEAIVASFLRQHGPLALLKVALLMGRAGDLHNLRRLRMAMEMLEDRTGNQASEQDRSAGREVAAKR